MIISESILTTFMASIVFKDHNGSSKIDSSLKLNLHQQI
jgi:hypothetical protein